MLGERPDWAYLQWNERECSRYQDFAGVEEIFPRASEQAAEAKTFRCFTYVPYLSIGANVDFRQVKQLVVEL